MYGNLTNSADPGYCGRGTNNKSDLLAKGDPPTQDNGYAVVMSENN